MKLVFFDDYSLGGVFEDGIVDFSVVMGALSSLPPQQMLNAVITDWGKWSNALEQIAGAATKIPIASVRLRAPVPKPASIICMAVNYMEFGTLKEKPAPQAFLKSSHSVIGHRDTMNLPDAPATIFEGEAELGLVIGKTATRVSVADAYDHVFGYLNFVDGSARGLPGGMGMPYFMKCQDDSAPLGPWLVTADEIGNPMNLEVRQWNNGKLTHDYNTDDMAHNIAESISFISANTTLEPGDVIALGTNHSGLHPLQDGDEVEQEITGLGRLSFTVADELNRTWVRQSRGERREANEEATAPQLSGKYS